MDIKTINKLEDLNKHQWEYGSGEYIIESNICGDLVLKRKNCIAENGHIYVGKYFEVHEKNLSELEIFGLKVVLNGKPKITRREKDVAESIDPEFWLSRDMSGDLYLSSHKPDIPKGFNHWRSKGWNLKINKDIFPFITWESGKAWSKAELLELEVIE